MGVIKGYEAPAKVNPYAADVDELIDAGEGAAYELIGATEKVEGVRGTIATEKVKFQNAARDAGYTARVVETEDMGENQTRVVFILTEKRERVVKPKGEAKAAK